MPHVPGHRPEYIGGGPPGGFVPGWQYPLSDPAAAVRNYLREKGIPWNPLNPAHQRMVSGMGAGFLPQFLASLQDISGTGAQGDFGNFIGEMLQGQRQPWSMGEAQAGLGRVGDLTNQALGQVQNLPEWASALTTQEQQGVLQRATMGGAISPLQMALAGLALDPQQSHRMFLNAFAPALGPFLGQGLEAATTPNVQLWQDYLSQAGFGQETDFASLLNFLLGIMRPQLAFPQGQQGRTGGIGGPQQFPGF